ncbi:hypothetical protein ACFFX0_09835 [Citricoccus parietis]|uniref:Uncharacterized protein n=1 Tax=Citricoccus parietis TaxID=592307 RepID=A0ABV5FXX1_9MICC
MVSPGAVVRCFRPAVDPAGQGGLLRHAPHYGVTVWGLEGPCRADEPVGACDGWKNGRHYVN